MLEDLMAGLAYLEGLRTSTPGEWRRRHLSGYMTNGSGSSTSSKTLISHCSVYNLDSMPPRKSGSTVGARRPTVEVAFYERHSPPLRQGLPDADADHSQRSRLPRAGVGRSADIPDAAALGVESKMINSRTRPLGQKRNSEYWHTESSTGWHVPPGGK